MVVRSILGEEHEFTESKVDILKLKYYPENPRVHHIISGLGKNPTQEDIEETMWERDATKDLFQDIKQNGLQDPILISDEYYVMEGNTRLCAFRNLFKQAKIRGDEEEIEKWRYIQCEMYPPGLDPLGMHYMLGRWHIKQKTEWDAFEKAGYIKRLMNDFDKTLEDISDELSMKKAEIKRMLWVEDVMVEEDVTNIKQYSHFEQCHQNPTLRDVFENEPVKRKKITGLIKSGNVGQAQNIRKLPKIMKSLEDGLEMLEKGLDFDQVYAKALEENPEDNPILKDMEKVSKKFIKFNTIDFLDEIENDKNKIDIVTTFIRDAETMKKLLESKNIINPE
ncbi:hypothetical protein HNV12_11805 [Methanococcoides sp. SA1]|nr:hypothetical protein [Methanococcoides sp. SA1]